VRITVRIPGEAFQELLEIVERKGYKNLSEGVRNAIFEFIENHSITWLPTNNIILERITVELPRGLLFEVDRMLEPQQFKSREDFIIHALREYIKNEKKNYAVLEREFSRAITEMRKKVETETFRSSNVTQ
jgi:metal-responsive CopG/Arc/MetJ family transcriptional regulator